MSSINSLSRLGASKKQAASVEFRNVTKRYGEVTAVDDVSFTIEPGKLVTLLGPSGCGKTTTLRMIAGLEMASEGQILIGGARRDEPVGRATATSAWCSSPMRCSRTCRCWRTSPTAHPCRASRRRTRSAMAMEKLSLIGLSGLEKRSPSELSGGQQQRVAVARALVLEPQVLLFDEPLSNLDAKLRRRVREDIRELQQSLNLTVAYVTHDQEEALAVSDHIIVMSNARIAQTGSPRELYEQPADLFVADFIGDANILCRRSWASGRSSRAGADRRIERPASSPGREAGQVKLAVRPDAIVLNDTASAAASHSPASYEGILPWNSDGI